MYNFCKLKYKDKCKKMLRREVALRAVALGPGHSPRPGTHKWDARMSNLQEAADKIGAAAYAEDTASAAIKAEELVG